MSFFKFKSLVLFIRIVTKLLLLCPFGNNSRHLAKKYARIFVRGHYLFREANSFPRTKTVSYEEQIMSNDKYPSIFSPQLEAIAFCSPGTQTGRRVIKVYCPFF